MKKHYSEEEQKALRTNPHVLEVREDRMSLTIEFRQQIYEKWLDSPFVSTIKIMLEDNGFNTRSLGENFVKCISHVFKRGGKPQWSKAVSGTVPNNHVHACRAAKSIIELTETGKFVWENHSISFHPEFEAELYLNYPEQSIEDGLRAAGISPEDVGYHRIYCLKRQFDDIDRQNAMKGIRKGRKITYPGITVAWYAKHPYIKVATYNSIVPNDAFFNTAAELMDLTIDEILKIFEIDPELFTLMERQRIRHKLDEWHKTHDSVDADTPLVRRILRNRNTALDTIAEREFKRIRELIPSMTGLEKKTLCQWIQQIPQDPGLKYTTKRMLYLLGISRSAYYAILKDEQYGVAAAEKRKEDALDAVLVRKVMEYKGFAKGSRQIYMMMPSLTGRHMGLKKIRRLMKICGVESSIRKPNNYRRGHRRILETNVKPNLLKRRFRLHRPNEVRLTDVTCLNYGNGLRAYGSALLDPVTGMLIAFNVSDNNDLDLVRETLRLSDWRPCIDGGMLHSDQGVLYLSGIFQSDVESMGLKQSMSKRGNCQDNAPQESFFGHFKDECDYAACQTLEELKTRVAEYADYYNNERCMWDRNRMTPARYEQYLLSMTEAEFAKYLDCEEAKYREMKEKATKQAEERAKNLGV